MKNTLEHEIELLGRSVSVLLIAGLLVVGGASAALLNSFGEITGDAEVEQAVYLEDADGDAVTDEDTIQASYDTEFVAGQTFTDHYTLVNDAPVEAKVDVQPADIEGVDVTLTTESVDTDSYGEEQNRMAQLNLDEVEFHELNPEYTVNIEDLSADDTFEPNLVLHIEGDADEVEGADSDELKIHTWGSRSDGEVTRDFDSFAEDRDVTVRDGYSDNIALDGNDVVEDEEHGSSNTHLNREELDDLFGDWEVTAVELRTQGVGDGQLTTPVELSAHNVVAEDLDSFDTGSFTVASGLELDFTHEADFDIALQPQEYAVETTVYPESEAP